MPVLRFDVTCEVGDDPESNETYHGWTAQEIRLRLPQFASLFSDETADDKFPRLIYCVDVYRYTIEPRISEYVEDENAEREARQHDTNHGGAC